MYIQTTYGFLLEIVLNTKILVVDNQEVGSERICIIPEYNRITLYCSLYGKDIEWLNPNNVVINSISTNRIHSKKLIYYSYY